MAQYKVLTPEDAESLADLLVMGSHVNGNGSATNQQKMAIITGVKYFRDKYSDRFQEFFDDAEKLRAQVITELALKQASK